MIGIRPGIVCGLNAGAASGIVADETGGTATSSYDLVAVFEGQNNAIAMADAAATSHSDSSYNHFTAFAGAEMTMLYAFTPVANPANPQVFLTTAQQGLKAYAAAGSFNQGAWTQFAKYMAKYGGYRKILIIIVAVGASSLRRNRGPAAAFPNSPNPTIWSSFLGFVTAAETAVGRRADIWHSVELESDAGDATDTAQAQANLAAVIAAYRAAGNASAAYVINQLNNATAAANKAAIRTAQAAAVSADARALLVNNDRFPIGNGDPNYSSVELNDIGDENGEAALLLLKPGASRNIGTGPAPWFQYCASGLTCVASPSTSSPRSGPHAADGDYEYLAVATYSVATTITLTTAAGFTLVGQATSTSGAIVRTLAVFVRPVNTAILAANSGRMPAPVIDCGTATLDVARVALVRGPSKWTADSTAGFAAAANNANNTGLTVPGLAGGTTTANNLVLMFLCTAGTTNAVASVTPGTGTQNYKLQQDGRYNPGAGTVGLAIATMEVAAAGAVGNTAVTFASTGINVGIAIYIKP